MAEPNPIISLIIVLFVVVFGLVIYFKVVGNNYRIKNFLNNVLNSMGKVEKIRQHFLIYSIIGGIILFIISLILKVNIIYFIYYVVISWITYLLIGEISTIYYKEFLTKKELFNFILFYFFIMLTYIVLFAQLYGYAFELKDGVFYLNERVKIMEGYDKYFISGITFFSYDVGLVPEGFMKIIIFIQLFLSQVTILGFFFIIFGRLIGKLNKKT